MATQDKSGGFSNAAMTPDNPTGAGGHNYSTPQNYGAPPPSYAPSAPPQQYGAPGAYPPQGAYRAPQQYGAYGAKQPYATNQQPQYGQSSSNVVVTNAYNPQFVVTQPARETGPAPSTTCSLVFAILSIFLCIGGWPFAVVSIVFNRKAKGQIGLGQYTMARNSLRTAVIFVVVAVVIGIIAWVIFGVRLKLVLDDIDKINNGYYNNRYNYG